MKIFGLALLLIGVFTLNIGAIIFGGITLLWIWAGRPEDL